MKWIPLSALLLCALAQQAHAESFHKCSGEGGAVAYRSQACLPGEQLVATLEPEPETRAPQRKNEAAAAAAPSRAKRSPSTRNRVARPRSRGSRKSRASRNPCASAKKARDDFQRRRGIKVTMDELSRWNHRVYDACK